MILSEEDIQEFRTLAQKDGVELTHQEASEAATRLILLYLRLALATPSERAAEGLANSSRSANLTLSRPANDASN